MNKVAVDFLKEKPTIVFVWPEFPYNYSTS